MLIFFPPDGVCRGSPCLVSPCFLHDIPLFSPRSLPLISVLSIISQRHKETTLSFPLATVQESFITLSKDLWVHVTQI